MKNTFPVSLFENNFINRFKFSSYISEIRDNNAPNPVIVFSFFKKDILLIHPEYSLLNLPGIYYLSLPFHTEELDNIIKSMRDLNNDEISYSKVYLNSPLGYILFFLNNTDEFSKLHLDRFKEGTRSLYGSVLDEIISSYLENHNYELFRESVFEKLPYAEINRLFMEFRHGQESDIVNKIFGPLNVLISSYKTGIVSDDAFRTIANEIITDEKNRIIFLKLRKLYNHLEKLTLFAEFGNTNILNSLQNVPDGKLLLTDNPDLSDTEILINEIEENINFLYNINNYLVKLNN